MSDSKPYRCPLCDGKPTVIHAKVCIACGGKGIVWSSEKPVHAVPYPDSPYPWVPRQDGTSDLPTDVNTTTSGDYLPGDVVPYPQHHQRDSTSECHAS